MKQLLIKTVSVLIALGSYPDAVIAAGNPEVGKTIAQQWCADCHLVSDDQASASADIPTFRAIAGKYDNQGALAAFIADPHPPMPTMSLTRQEIRDLVAYIGSLR